MIELVKSLKGLSDTDKVINVSHKDCLAGMKNFGDKAFDFCLTSPPYYDAEIYDGSASRYRSYGEWFDEFLVPVVEEARRICDQVAINIANTGGYPIADDLRRFLQSKSLFLVEDCIRIPQRNGKHRDDPLFVISDKRFYKGRPVISQAEAAEMDCPFPP